MPYHYNEISKKHSCSSWRSIRASWDSFVNNISFVVVDDSLARFWHDIWCENHVLKELHPKLFSIAINKELL